MLLDGDTLRFVVGRGGDVGGNPGTLMQGGGGGGTPPWPFGSPGGGGGGGFSSVELYRRNSGRFIPLIVAAGGGGAGGEAFYAANGGDAGITAAWRGGDGGDDTPNPNFNTRCTASIALTNSPCVQAATQLIMSTLGGGASTVGGLSSFRGLGDGSSLKGGDASLQCLASAAAQRVSSPAPSPSNPPCLGPGGGGGGGWLGGGAGMNGPGGGGSSFVDVGIIMHCDPIDNINSYLLDEGASDPNAGVSTDPLSLNQIHNDDDPVGFWRQENIPEAGTDFNRHGVDGFRDICILQTGATAGHIFSNAYPSSDSDIGVGGAPGLRGGDGLIVLELPQGIRRPSSTMTSSASASKPPRTPRSTRSVTPNPSRSRVRKALR